MGIVRRLFSIGTGLAAGVLAYKLLDRFNAQNQLEGEYRVLAPEENVTAPAAEEQTARADEADGEVPAPEAEEEVPAPAEAEPAAEAAPAVEAPDDDAPNPNPVMREAEESAMGPDGKIDPTKVADAADFGNWDDLGCKG